MVEVASWAVVLVWSSWWSAHHVGLVVELSVDSLILLHDVEQLLEDLSHVWVTGEVIEVEGS